MTSPHDASSDDPHDFVVVPPDVARMAPTEDELARLARSLRTRSETIAVDDVPVSVVPPNFVLTAAAHAAPDVDTTFRATAADDAPVTDARHKTARRSVRSFLVALALATGTAATGVAWENYSGKDIIARWTPQFLQPHVAIATPDMSGDAPPAVAQATTVASASEAPASLASATDNDIAGMRQEIAQLKADIEQLKAGQQTAARDTSTMSDARTTAARVPDARAEQIVQPRIASRPPVARSRKPPAPRQPQYTAANPSPLVAPAQPIAAPAPPPTYAATTSSVPQRIEPSPQTLADPELSSVPRPPLPVR